MDWDIRSSDSCVDHFVQAFDGIFDYSPPLTGKLCSSSTPQPIRSHGNKMKLIFESSVESSGERGFKASYTSDDKRICGGDFENPSTDILIQSPNYPKPFDPNTECDYYFHGPVGIESTFDAVFRGVGI